MPNSTPRQLDSPVVHTHDARLIVHEVAVTSVLLGFKKLNPKVFSIGTYESANTRPPVQIPMPFDGTLPLNYKISIANLHVDLYGRRSPNTPVPNPFTLRRNQLAIYADISVTLAGEPVSKWSETVVLHTWLHCNAALEAGDMLVFGLIDARVKIDDVRSQIIERIVNNILKDYISQNLERIRFRISGAFEADFMSGAISSFEIYDDSADVFAVIQGRTP